MFLEYHCRTRWAVDAAAMDRIETGESAQQCGLAAPAFA